LAFVLVSAGVWIMRRSDPAQPRPFRAPLSSPRFPLVPLLGALLCALLIVSLDRFTLQIALAWMGLGFVVYFLYGRSHSKLQQGIVVVPTEAAPAALLKADAGNS
ncbi:amino acid permease C-terminal domain-containing protein, partial [Hymenobacter sp. BT491]|uniref:amino acid permease C-terminal domain-containing protein n=1 Tax=Hymenobacter sp. BT491 TaxID=2766779 RepID=UPI001983964D